jgi:hypothetical protein
MVEVVISTVVPGTSLDSTAATEVAVTGVETAGTTLDSTAAEEATTTTEDSTEVSTAEEATAGLLDSIAAISELVTTG